MTIQEWFDEAGENDTTLGAKVGRSARSIGVIRRGDGNASFSLVVRIVRASGGRIDPYTIPMSPRTREDVDAWLSTERDRLGRPAEQTVPVERDEASAFACGLERAR